MLLDRYQHISFDLDGTLIHTTPEYRYDIVPRALRALGCTNITERAVDRFWFDTDRKTTVREEFDVDPLAFWAELRKYYTADSLVDHTWVYDDVAPALRQLKDLGKTLSIITGARDEVADMEVNKLERDSFDAIRSTDYERGEEKPNPGAMHVVLGELGLSAADTVYIGNSNEDADFARNAECDFIYLERKEHDFRRHDCTAATIHSLDELFTL